MVSSRIVTHTTCLSRTEELDQVLVYPILQSGHERIDIRIPGTVGGIHQQ